MHTKDLLAESRDLQALMHKGIHAVYDLLKWINNIRQEGLGEADFEPVIANWLDEASRFQPSLPLLELADESLIAPIESAVLLILYAFHESDEVRGLCALIRRHRTLNAPSLELLAECVQIGCALQPTGNLKQQLKKYVDDSCLISIRHAMNSPEILPNIMLSQTACEALGLLTDAGMMTYQRLHAAKNGNLAHPPACSQISVEHIQCMVSVCQTVWQERTKQFCGLLHGDDVSGHRAFLSYLSAQIGVPAAEVRIGNILARPTAPYDIQDLFLDVMKCRWILYIPDLDVLFDTPVLQQTLIESLQRYVGIAFFSAYESKAFPRRFLEHIHVKLEFAVPSQSERQKIWESHLPLLKKRRHHSLLYKLSAEFNFNRSQIERAVQFAVSVDSPAHVLEYIEESCQIVATDSFGKLTEPTNVDNVSIENYILPPDQMAQYTQILRAAHAHDTIMSDWGFGERLSTGKGLCILFDGPPGTGKTFGAEVLAAEIGRPLQRVDMSAVVSKYIGDTGSNLAQIFKTAKSTNAILLLDEADALLSKRVAKAEKSTDRYANMEINILLQEIERFSGIVILTTNLENILDEALHRRIQYRITFKMPEAGDREALWRSHIPAPAPTDANIDFKKLSEAFELSGGQIKNAVLHAAYAACSEGKPIGMTHLCRAAIEECTKSGHLVSHRALGLAT